MGRRRRRRGDGAALHVHPRAGDRPLQAADHHPVLGGETAFDHAQRADLLAEKLNARGRGWVLVNPIPLNPTPGSVWTSSEVPVQDEFVRRLNAAGIPTTLRDTRGKEIDGACGQLVATEDDQHAAEDVPVG